MKHVHALALAALASLITVQADPAAALEAQWTQKAGTLSLPDGPGGRGWINLFYDELNQKIGLFGGSGETYLNDIWHYDATVDKWIKIQPFVDCAQLTGFVPPSKRDEHTTVYDAHNHRYWTFGGSGFNCHGSQRSAKAGTNSTTLVDPTLTATTVDYYKDWTVQTSGGSAYVSTYDPANKRLTLKTPLSSLTSGTGYYLHPQRGGGLYSYSVTDKTWTPYSGPRSVYTGPSPWSRLSPAMAYSDQDRAFVMFGGEGNAGMNDTWAFDVETKTWVQMKSNGSSSAPPARAQLQDSMVYDSDRDLFVLFGGRCKDPARCTYNASMNDTWTYKLSTNTWTKLNPAVSPPPRIQHQMAYDPDNRVTIVFGGVGPTGIVNDLWAFDATANTWTQIPFATGPSPRYLASIEYDKARRLFVLYGGAKTGRQVWTLKLTDGGATPNQPPVAKATAAPTSGNTGTVFQFDASGSFDPDGGIQATLWTFGDGGSSTAAIASHQYAAAGTYTVGLKVTDNDGVTATAQLNVSVTGVVQPVSLRLNNLRVRGTVDDPSVTEILVNGNPVPVSGGVFEYALSLPTTGGAVLNFQVPNTTAKKTMTLDVQ